MTDPALLESLDGQQYLVLRPEDEIETFWDVSRESLRESIAQPVSYPHTGHVTLRGFLEPDRVDELKAALTTWAQVQPPIELKVVGIDGFPPPFQIVHAELKRTSSLVSAYAGLTSLLDSTDFHRIGELPLEDWVFHMSLIYAGGLDEVSWARIYDRCRRVLEQRPAETITSADFVWYTDGAEHVERLMFAAK
ncbi:2'-5' RNA ligase family protein [Microbacterium salsuginis]|nr:2'-5' RNA ligase family protein [Microbacterium sp. CFH 90308]